MLPSTGYFNGINCPFYENGPCDRPYCHFRHARKDLQNTNNDGMDSGAILQKLVSAAVQRVLQKTEVSVTISPTQVAVVDTIADIDKSIVSTAKATYNPTPIAELNKINNSDAENSDDINEQRKRHIPVPYTPRKPASIPIKRPVDTNGSSKPFIYNPPPLKYTPGSADSIPNDMYTPPGAVESKEIYLPGTEKELPEYSPDATTQDTANKRNYVPSSDKSGSKKKVLEYKPSNPTKTSKSSVTYQPTPRYLAPCFSSDDEEPETKKTKLSGDLNGLDDLGPEFDILDQILHEEVKVNIVKDVCDKSESKQSTSDSKGKNGDTSKNKKDKSHLKSEKKEESLSENKDKKEKLLSEDKEKSHSKDKDKKENNHERSDKKSNHNSCSREKEKDQRHSKSKEKDRKEKNHKVSKDKHSTDNKKRHSSKNSDDSHKHKSSKKSEKHSDSKSTRSDSKTKEKRRKEKEKRHKSKFDDKEKGKKVTADLSDNDDFHMEENGNEEDETGYYLSDADEETIELECKKIFEEYVPTEQPKNLEENHKIEDITEKEYIPGKKRVSRTADKNIKIIPKTLVKPDFKVNAAQAMAERLAKVREFHNSRQPPTPVPPTKVETPSNKIDFMPKNTSSTTSTSSKIRIAHVPYASTMLNAKRTMTSPSTKINSQPSTSSTICQTVKKGVQRVAHVPSEKFIDRPGVLEPLASKIAANIRSIYLNMMIDECLKLYISHTDAYARAQHEELNTSKKCSTVQIYKNSAVLAVSRLRKELQECNGLKKTSDSCSVIGNSSNKSNAGSWSIENKNRKVYDNSFEFVGAKFYKNISKWVLTEEQLRSNGFPRPHTSGEKGRAIIYGQNKQQPPKGYLRTCCRCKKQYMVNKKGVAAVTEECIYHPNRIYRVRGEAKYQCCSQDATSDGCCVAPSHVYEYVDFENLKGYVTTMPPETEKDDYGIYSLDCEMSYTTHGLDLTRLTVIDSSCKVIYESLVRPLHPIIDYNTRYSGITEEQMANVRTTLLEVQATLLAMFSSKTILVGHSLESDFKALKLIHDTVVDTSVLFPHKMGPPYKRALRNLSSEHLKKIIQNSVEGHDSAEDAMVCMELLYYKLKEDLKTR